MKTKKNNQKNLIIFIALVVLIVSILFIVLKGSDNGTNDNGDNDIVEKDTYKTKDKRFTLKIVEVGDVEAYNNAKLRYGEDAYDQTIRPNVKLYAYINNSVFAIDEVVEDENYALYSFIGLPTEEYGHKMIVNKKNNLIEVSDDDLKKTGNNCLSNGFCGFQSQPSFIKSNSGYYFINNEKGLVTIYTTNWNKIGYVDKASNIQFDVDGNIKLYKQVEKSSCNGDYCEYQGIGEAVWYDINGNRK